MRIELVGWKSEGLRCPDVEVDLRRAGRVPKVALVQMPNGTGKTTTLELLNATLSGSAHGWSLDRVRGFRRSRDRRAEGRFKATLLVDGKPLSIELVLNYSTGKASYLTTNPGSGGVEPRWRVPPSLNRFLTREFLSLFIFDGEFANRLLDGGQAEADRVVDTLCQIYLLNEAAVFADEHWEKSAKADTTRTESGLERLVRNRDELVEREKGLSEELETARANSDGLGKELQELRKNIDARVNSNVETRRLRREAEAARAEAETEVVESRGKLLDALRLPHAVHPDLAVRLVNLRESLERLRLPENTSAQFFKELVEHEECICGRPMDDSAVAEITSRANRYLDSADAGVINAMKHDIEQYTGNQGDEEGNTGHKRVLRLRGELSSAVRKEKRAKQQVRVLMGQLIEAGDEELEKWQNEAVEIESRRKDCDALVSVIEGPGSANESPESTNSLSTIKKAIDELNGRIAQIRGTVQLRERTELVKGLLDAAGKRARERIKRELLEECNRTLSVILQNDPLVIDRIDRSVHLQGQKGASAGQTLAIGYTFLMSVLNRGQNDFPLVVDSPAGPIDRSVRRRIGRILPSLCNQFVGFTINTERDGFVDALERSVDDIIFLTLFRKTPGTSKMTKGLPDGRYTETDNAVLVNDRAYFYDFDIQDEEEEDAIQAS